MAPTPPEATRFKPGQVGNPEGRNQYTYRAEAEQHLEEWCKEYGRELVRVIADEARRGRPWAAKLILDRVLPAVTKHEVDLGESTPLDAFIQSVGSIPSRRGNGKDLEAEPSGPTKGNGGDV
jgi:hypothetical protein